MRRRPHPPRPLGTVAGEQSLKWWIPGGNPPQDLVGGQPGRDVEEDPAVRGAPARLDLRVVRTRYLVAAQQLRRAPIVVGVGVPPVGLFLGLGVQGPEHGGTRAEPGPPAL